MTKDGIARVSAELCGAYGYDIARVYLNSASGDNVRAILCAGVATKLKIPFDDVLEVFKILEWCMQHDEDEGLETAKLDAMLYELMCK
jgi:hypothetical protein